MSENEQDPVFPIRVSINSMLDLVTRIDERVLALTQKGLNLEKELDLQLDSLNELYSKVQVLESQNSKTDIKNLENDYHNINLRIQTLENSSSKQELRWKSMLTFAIQLIWVILASYLLYKLGIQSPEVP